MLCRLTFISNSDVQELLVDPDNFDFRPKMNNALMNTDNSYSGPYSPYIGSLNTSDDLKHYWIPGRKERKASFPVPKDGSTIRQMRDVVMCQTGYR